MMVTMWQYLFADMYFICSHWMNLQNDHSTQQFFFQSAMSKKQKQKKPATD